MKTKKIVEIERCADCPRKYWNYSLSGDMKDGKNWCSKSNMELNANKMFHEIPDWCELPNVN